MCWLGFSTWLHLWWGHSWFKLSDCLVSDKWLEHKVVSAWAIVLTVHCHALPCLRMTYDKITLQGLFEYINLKLHVFQMDLFLPVTCIFCGHGELFLERDVRCVSDSIKEITYLRLEILVLFHFCFILESISFRLHCCKMASYNRVWLVYFLLSL